MQQFHLYKSITNVEFRRTKIAQGLRKYGVSRKDQKRISSLASRIQKYWKLCDYNVILSFKLIHYIILFICYLQNKNFLIKQQTTLPTKPHVNPHPHLPYVSEIYLNNLLFLKFFHSCVPACSEWRNLQPVGGITHFP